MGLLDFYFIDKDPGGVSRSFMAIGAEASVHGGHAQITGFLCGEGEGKVFLE